MLRQADAPGLMITMAGLRNYLRKRKVGEPFEMLQTFLGWKEFWDEEDAEERRMAASRSYPSFQGHSGLI